MNRNRIWIVAACTGLYFFVSFATAGDMTLRNDFTFYGDNTEFFEPFRLRQTLLGQQFKSYLNLQTGERTSLWGGLFADHPSAFDSTTTVQPILSFVYHDAGFQGIFGTLQPINRHGLLEPMEVTTLELTRPIEYGMQWIQDEDFFKADLFLDWQQLLTPSSREIFDYGGTARFVPFSPLELGMQIHCYHVGGVTYGGIVRNNFAGGVGLTFKGELPLLGKSSLGVFGFGSNDTNRPGYPGPINGAGLYTKGTFSPDGLLEFFGIVWVGKDYMSEEGDSNYNSYGYDGVYYLSDRHYEEVGLRRVFAIESGATFDIEFRSHWIEDSWAHSFRIVAQVPFDVDIDLKKNQRRHEDSKTQRKDQDEDTQN